jgi:citrate synthase
VQACGYSSSSEPTLKETFERVLPAKRELLKKVKAQADKKLGDVKVENALGGMRYAHSNAIRTTSTDRITEG